VLLELVIRAPKIGGLMKSCSYCSFSILRIVSAELWTSKYCTGQSLQVSSPPRISSYCKDSGMIDCGLHSTWHFCRVQPISVTFEEPLKNPFNRASDRYLRRRAHEEMTPYGPTYFPTKAIWRLVKWKKMNIRLQSCRCLPTQPRNVIRSWVWIEWKW